MDRRLGPSERALSFRYALRGLLAVVRDEPNARIHLAATVAVVALGALLGLSAASWCWLVASIAAVWCAEAFNTALERLADAAHPAPHPLVAQAKDAAAGAVLVASIAAATIGLLVLGPPLLAFVARQL